MFCSIAVVSVAPGFWEPTTDGGAIAWLYEMLESNWKKKKEQIEIVGVAREDGWSTKPSRRPDVPGCCTTAA